MIFCLVPLIPFENWRILWKIMECLFMLSVKKWDFHHHSSANGRGER
nr:MAG TPA: hypothetical protein [Caudoviricetes sp.]